MESSLLDVVDDLDSVNVPTPDQAILDDHEVEAGELEEDEEPCREDEKESDGMNQSPVCHEQDAVLRCYTGYSVGQAKPKKDSKKKMKASRLQKAARRAVTQAHLSALELQLLPKERYGYITWVNPADDIFVIKYKDEGKDQILVAGYEDFVPECRPKPRWVPVTYQKVHFTRYKDKVRNVRPDTKTLYCVPVSEWRGCR